MNTGSARLLLFRLKEQRYALQLQDVAEVLPPPVTFPVPWVPSYLTGVMNFHGSLVAVLDLAQFFGTGTMAADGTILVLGREIGNLALGIDRVENIIPVDDVLEEDESSNPMVEKVLILPDGAVSKLAVGTLLQRVTEAMQR